MAAPQRARRGLIEPGDPGYVAPAGGAVPGSFLGCPPAELAGPASSLPSPQPPWQHQPPADEPAPPTDKAMVDGPAPAPETAPAGDEAAAGKGKRLSEPALWAIEITAWVAAAILLSTLLRLFVFQMFLVPSTSMQDTLQNRDRIAALKLADFRRGDIVVFSDPGGWLTEPVKPVGAVRHFFEKIGLLASTDQQYLVKRVIGLPGDRVQCCSAAGRLVVNGVELDEAGYLKDPSLPASGIVFDVTVPAGRIFVMGDNRYNSADSRVHLCQDNADGLGMGAFVPTANVVGPVRAVVLPLGRTGHRPTPTGVFGAVPAPANPPPATASVSVTSGWPETCHS